MITFNMKRVTTLMLALLTALAAFAFQGCGGPKEEPLPLPSSKTGTSYLSPVPDVTPLTRENIIINAYLVPLQNEELRRSQFEYMQRAEIDVVSHIYVDDVWVAEGHTIDKYLPIMREAAEYGLKIYSRDIRVQQSLNYTDAELVNIAKEYENVPGFAGFYVVDEPYDPNPYARAENALRSVFPDCYVNINFLPRGAYPEGTFYKRLTDFGSLVDGWGTLSLDTYCFGKDGGVDEYQLFKNYDDLRRAALATNMNTAVYVQSVGYVNYRRPSAGDLRYNMMAALAYGVKELKFFTWGKPWGVDSGYTDAIFDADKQPTDLYDAVCVINKKIHVLGTYLAAGDAVAVYHTRQKTAGAYEKVPADFPVQGLERTDAILSVIQPRSGGDQFLFVVNKNFSKPQTLTFSVGDLALKLVDDNTGELTAAPVTDGVLTLELEPGDAALLKCEGTVLFDPAPETHENLAINAKLSASSAAGDGEAFLCDIHDGVTDDGGMARLITENGAAQYITLDLGEIKEVNRVDLYPGGSGSLCGYNYPTDFRVLTSADGNSWTEVVSKTGFTFDRAKVPVFRFAAIRARYVRVAVLFPDTSGRSYTELGEIAIYNDGGDIPDDIPTLYVPGEDTLRSLVVGKSVFEKGEEITVKASGLSTDYVVFYPVGYVPGQDAGVYYACFDTAEGNRADWYQLENGKWSNVNDWYCATPQNPQVVPYINIPAGEYKVVMRANNGLVVAEARFTVK